MNGIERFTNQISDTVSNLVDSVAHLQEYKTTARIHHSTLELIVGRIEQQEVDVVVNAASTALAGGSDIGSAIHKAAGPQLMAASRVLAPCRVGDAVLTPGFKLPIPWVIHTVGPIYAGGHQNEAMMLDKAYRNSMTLALQSGLTRMAFPPISVGANGFPLNEAAQIALGAVLEYIDGYRNSELLIRFVLSSRHEFAVYNDLLRKFSEANANSASSAGGEPNAYSASTATTNTDSSVAGDTDLDIAVTDNDLAESNALVTVVYPDLVIEESSLTPPPMEMADVDSAQGTGNRAQSVVTPEDMEAARDQLEDALDRLESAQYEFGMELSEEPLPEQEELIEIDLIEIEDESDIEGDDGLAEAEEESDSEADDGEYTTPSNDSSDSEADDEYTTPNDEPDLDEDARTTSSSDESDLEMDDEYTTPPNVESNHAHDGELLPVNKNEQL